MSTNWLDIVTSGSTTVDVPVGTSLVNAGLLGVTSAASLNVDVVGAFTNDGVVIADGGTLTLSIATTGDETATAQNTGLMDAVDAGTLNIKSDGTGAFSNTGLIAAVGGTIDVASDVSQSDSGAMTVTDNGTLNLDDKVSGGTIAIQSGMLAIGNAQALAGLSAALSFIGSTGTIDFAGAQDVTENYSTILHSLIVDVTYAPNNTVHAEIAMPETGYSAADFTVQGHDIVYAAHPTS